MNYPFKFTAKCWDEEEKKTYEIAGMGICISFSHAAEIIDTTFGTELIAIKHLELFADDNIICLPKECIEKYEKSNFPMCDFRVYED